MTQHTTNTPKVPISDIVSPNMSPQADAAVQGAMERAAEKQAIKSLASRWHEMRNTAETKAQFERELDEYIDANYLPKAKVVEAERRGEISQLKMLLHMASLHGTELMHDFVEHALKSLEQVPSQPLASETLRKLGLESE